MRRRDVGNGMLACKVISRLEVLALYLMNNVRIFGIKLDFGCVWGILARRTQVTASLPYS